MSPVIIISPDFPPRTGGLADHTQRLAKELSRTHSVSVLSSFDVVGSIAFEVRPEIVNWHDSSKILSAILAESPDATLLWQYVPHMYGRGGVNRAVPSTIEHLHRIGRRQIVVTHEIEAGWNWSTVFSGRLHWLWYTWQQRRQWEQICRSADSIPLTVEAWVQTWQRKRPELAQKFSLVASPSNLDPIAVPPDHSVRWREAHQLPGDIPILLYFGSLNASKRLEWVKEAWLRSQQTSRPVAWVAVGDQPDIAIPPRYQKYFRALGFLENDEASAAFHAANAVALPFLDGISERRSSAMAGFAHGIAVVSTYGHNTGPTLRTGDFLRITDAADANGFVASASALISDLNQCRSLGERGENKYLRDYSWTSLSERLRKLIG